MFHITHVTRYRISLCGLAALGLTAAFPAQAQLSVFSSGLYSVPETISVVPPGFGAYGRQFFISDFSNNAVYAVPATGGAPTFVAATANTSLSPIGGLFVPSAYGGAAAGNYVVFGNGTGSIVTASGAISIFTSVSGARFTTALLAPAAFGAYGSQIIAFDQAGKSVFAINSGGAATQITSFGAFVPFGSAAVPYRFGSVGGKILVDDATSGNILALSPNGATTPFATVALKSGQFGLRQMTFAPVGFFPGVNEPLLLVSVAGSTAGGGTLGDVLVYDNAGNVVKSLRTDLGLTALDSRGLYFLDSTHLLLADSSHTAGRPNGQILELTAQAFASITPEPGAVALLGALFTVGGSCFRSRRARRV